VEIKVEAGEDEEVDDEEEAEAEVEEQVEVEAQGRNGKREDILTGRYTRHRARQ
jgi:hypothetical protein